MAKNKGFHHIDLQASTKFHHGNGRTAASFLCHPSHAMQNFFCPFHPCTATLLSPTIVGRNGVSASTMEAALLRAGRAQQHTKVLLLASDMESAHLMPSDAAVAAIITAHAATGNYTMAWAVLEDNGMYTLK